MLDLKSASLLSELNLKEAKAISGGSVTGYDFTNYKGITSKLGLLGWSAYGSSAFPICIYRIKKD